MVKLHSDALVSIGNNIIINLLCNCVGTIWSKDAAVSVGNSRVDRCFEVDSILTGVMEMPKPDISKKACSEQQHTHKLERYKHSRTVHPLNTHAHNTTVDITHNHQRRRFSVFYGDHHRHPVDMRTSSVCYSNVLPLKRFWVKWFIFQTREVEEQNKQSSSLTCSSLGTGKE